MLPPGWREENMGPKEEGLGCLPGKPSGEFLPHVFDDEFTRQVSGQFLRQITPLGSAHGTPRDRLANVDGLVPLMGTTDLEEELQIGAPGGTEWWQSLLVILASVIGVGVLSLPQAVAAVGWLPGAAAMAACTAAAWWSGRAYGQLTMAVPGAQVLGDISEAAFGWRGRVLTMWLGYTFIAGACVVYHVSASKALQQMYQGIAYFECQPIAGMLFGLVMLPPLQVQSMHAVSLLSILGFLTILVALAIVTAKLVAAGPAPGTSTALAEPFHLNQYAAAVTCCVYAFGGQAFFVELIAKQRDRASFRHAVDISMSVACIFYTFCGSLGYAYIGKDIRGPLTSMLPAGPSTRTVNTCLLVHVAIGYVILMNVLTDAVLRLIGAGTSVERALNKQAPFSRLSWLAASVFLVASAYVVGSSIPFFTELVSLVGALTCTTLMLMLPALATLRLLPGLKRMACLQCYAALPVSLALTLLGTSGALANIADAITNQHQSQSWACAAPGGSTA